MWQFKLGQIRVENTNKANAAMESQASTLRPGSLINRVLNSGSTAINGEVVSKAGGWWMEVKELASR